MIRYTLLTCFIALFSAYAFRNWFHSLCALLFLTAVMERPDMPEAMFGVSGFSPFNLLLLFVMLGYMARDRKDDGVSHMEPGQKRILWVMLMLLVIGVIRMAYDGVGLIYLDQFGYFTSKGDLFSQHVLVPLKWVIPGLLVMAGCNTQKRFNELTFVTVLVVVICSILILKSMPLSYLADGDALQKRAARVFDRDIGYHRNQISIWLASGFWVVWLKMLRSDKWWFKYILLLTSALIFMGLVLTGSRGGLLCWVGVGAVFGWLRWRRILLLTPAILAIAILTVPALKERLMSGYSEDEIANYSTSNSSLVRGDVEQYAAASAGRTILWAFCFEKIKEAPIFGHGREAMIRTGISADLLGLYGKSMAMRHPHNAFIQVILDNGLVGLLIVLVLFRALIKKSVELFKGGHEHGIIVGGYGIAWIGCFLFSGLTASSFYPNEGTVFVWCAIGAILGMPSAAELRSSRQRIVQDRATPSGGIHHPAT